MKTIVGKYLIQANQDFPLDADTLSGIEDNIFLVSILGNIAGDKAIILGCELEQNNTRRAAGFVFLHTQDYPNGEVLYWEGGAISSGMYIKKESVAVSTAGYEFPQAYIMRSLAAGVGTENYSWNDFAKVLTNQELAGVANSLQTQINNLGRSPLGMIELWAGATTPDGYALCDGRALKRSEYPELFAVLGTTYNTAVNYNGAAYTTPSDSFRLPDLRGRFVVGQNPEDTDYNAPGKAGGSKNVTLNASELPTHKHPFKDYYYIEAIQGGLDGSDWVQNTMGSSRTDYDNNWLAYRRHDTEDNTGGGSAHENRPPFYALAYVMRLK